MECHLKNMWMLLLIQSEDKQEMLSAMTEYECFINTRLCFERRDFVFSKKIGPHPTIANATSNLDNGEDKFLKL